MYIVYIHVNQFANDKKLSLCKKNFHAQKVGEEREWMKKKQLNMYEQTLTGLKTFACTLFRVQGGGEAIKSRNTLGVQADDNI